MPNQAVPASFRTNVRLADYSTIGLGGPARLFASCESVNDIRSALEYAHRSSVNIQVFGGGSNIIFPDDGLEGLVLHIALRGVATEERASEVVVDAAAGETWDNLVVRAVERGWGGIECLSGIPGTVGATPIQNVGAYGQEVSETLSSVNTIDRTTGNDVQFGRKDCDFGYRQSRFKGSDRDRFIITHVRFRFPKDGAPSIRYPELQRELDARGGIPTGARGKPALLNVREAVLAIRHRKSMVIDPQDENTRSVGSFFTNPVVPQATLDAVKLRWKATGDGSPVPFYAADDGYKMPAAWLVERAGFSRGFRMGGVGISAHHSLALVNLGGTTAELLSLADSIRTKVRTVFGIYLELEPVVVSSRR